MENTTKGSRIVEIGELEVIGQGEDGRPMYRRADVVAQAKSLSASGVGVDVLTLSRARRVTR